MKTFYNNRTPTEGDGMQSVIYAQVLSGVRWLGTITDFRLEDTVAFTQAVAHRQLGKFFTVTYWSECAEERQVTVRLVYIHNNRKVIVREYFGDKAECVFFVLHLVGSSWEGPGYAMSARILQAITETELYENLKRR